MDVEAIHEGLATRANTISGLRGFPSLPGSINPPTFAPTEFSMEYHGTFSGGSGAGLSTGIFQCGLFPSLGDTDAGRKALLAYLAESGSSSILAAIEGDKTLGGAAKTLIVVRVHGAYRLYEIGGVQYLGAMLEVKVWA